MNDKIRLLVVEDEFLIAQSLQLALEDLGYEVAGVCASYEEARRAFATQPTDLVLLDLNLNSPNPDANGLALAAELRALNRPFIFLTAYDDLDTIRRAASLQPAGYLIKPANNATLFAAIQTALERLTTHEPAPPPTAAFREQPSYFFAKVGHVNHRLYWNDVLCLEAGKNYVTIRTAQPRVAYPVRGSLTSVVDELIPAALRAQFVRVNRSTRVNQRFVTSFDTKWVYCGEYGRFELTESAHEQLMTRLI